LIESTSG